MAHTVDATPVRRDAARNRDQILAAAARIRSRGDALQLNAVAREAQVGVGTVYRHFPVIEALEETLVRDRFVELQAAAEQAAADPDAGPALRRFLSQALAAYVADDLFAAVATTRASALDETREVRRNLLTTFSTLLDRVGGTGALRSSLTAPDALALVCGVAYAMRTTGSTDSSAYLSALLDGLLDA